MKRFIILLALLILPVYDAMAEDAVSSRKILTLKEAYQKALAQSERVMMGEQAILQAEALYQETFSAALPSFSYRYSTLWQDQSGLTQSEGLGIFTQSPQSEGVFQFKKTGLTFYKEWAALRAGKSFINQRRYEKQQVDQTLLSSVAIAYYGILEAEENLATTRQLIDLTRKRLEVLSERARVGRSRATDPLGAQFQLTVLSVEEQEALRLVAVQRDLLGFLMSDRTHARLAGPIRVNVRDFRLEYYIKQAESRPDIQARRAALETAQGALKIARSKDFTSLDIGVNYYTHREGSREPIDWDASLTLQIPLYSWGANHYAIAGEKSLVHQRAQDLQAVRRQAELEVRNAYKDLFTNRKKMTLAEEGVSLARQDYELQSQDEKKGLVTSLEVLEALNRLNQAEHALTHFRLQFRLSGLNLELIAGASAEEALK